MPRNRLHEDDVLVVGLGRFGAAAASELQRLGHRVVGIEKNPELAAALSGAIAKVITADATSPAVLEALHAKTFRIAVVGLGASLEDTALACDHLLEAGVPVVWAKAWTPAHARILKRLGVHRVVQPESETGRRVAHLVNGRLLDYIEFVDGFAIVQMLPPRETIGFTLAQSQIRSKYGVDVIGVKAADAPYSHADGRTRILAGHSLIVSGPSDLVERFAARP